jgi:hypothetical protein
MGVEPEQDVPPAQAPADPAAGESTHVPPRRPPRIGWLLSLILVVTVPVASAATDVLQALDVSPGPFTRALLAVLPVLGLVIALPKLLKEWLPEQSTRVRRIIVGLVGVAFFALLWLLYVTRDPFGGVELERLSGTRDVAILGFALADGSPAAELEDLSNVLAQQLQPALGNSTAHSYAGDVRPSLSGLDPASSARDDLDDYTSEFVQRTGGEVVLAGLVDDSSGQLTMRPAVYISPTLVAEAPELLGWFLGDPVVTTGSLSSARGRDLLLAPFVDDVVRLTTFTDALDAWRVGRAAEAAELFSGLTNESGPSVLTPDLVHLFAGHALTTVALRGPPAELSAALHRARGEYDAIGSASAIATRAELSRAGNTYLQAVGNVCQAGTVDEQGLADASATLLRIARDTAAAPIARLVGDVNFARVEQCRLTAGLPGDPAELEAALVRVRLFPVDAKGPQAQVVRELQALAAALTGERAAAAGDLEVGIASMREAIRLSDGLADRGRWWAFISAWQLRSCDIPAGQEAQREALTQLEAAVRLGEVAAERLAAFEQAFHTDLEAAQAGCGQ